MRPPRNAKAARLAPAALVKRHNRPDQHNARSPILQPFQRSAQNWLGDALVYLADGDGAAAFMAACRAARVLRRLAR